MTEVAGRLGTESLSAEEIADAVWLAARIAAAEQPQRPANSTADSAPPDLPPSRPHEPSGPSPGLPALDDPSQEYLFAAPVLPEPVSAAEPQRHDIPDSRESSQSPVLSRELAKALLPLNRLVPSTWRDELDEERTAIAAAESRVWFPLHRPAQEHPFELVLVIDRSSSMRIWTRTAAAFRSLLERQGAFSDVRTMWVNTDEKTVAWVETAPGTACPPALLADPTGRRVVLVLTDGAGPAWRSGSMFELMSMWARTCQVGLVHLLPTELWRWTGIDVEPRMVSTVPPGAAKSIPVLSLEPRYLRRWAALISGTSGVRLPVLMPLSDDETEGFSEESLSVEERLHRFQSTASPDAMHLAGLLAGAAPLTLPVIQAVRDRLLPESEQWHLSEVLLSGLLYRAPASRDGSRAPDFWEFMPGVRPKLLATSRRDDTAHVLRIVADVCGEEYPSGALRRVLLAPDDEILPTVTRQTAQLLAAQKEVLAALGGPYTRRANRLGDALDAYNTLRGKATPSGHLSDAVEGGHGSQLPDGLTSGRSDVVPTGTIQSGTPSVTLTSSAPGSEISRSGKQAIWGGVPLRNVNFIGRKEMLEALHNQLSTSTTTAVVPGALHGMGGIGKSQIAIEYVYRHSTEYDLIWWIPSEERQGIQNSLVELAQRLELPVERSVDTAVPAVLEALSIGEPYRRWLLVFDNADQPEDVRRFWPRRGEGHILVTSRNSRWVEVAQAVEVNVFQRVESRELLQRRNVGLANDDADRLAAALGDLPLAIEQAAAWRAETGMATNEYLQLLDDKRTELLDSRAPVDYDLTVMAVLDVSLDRVEKEKPGARKLLDVCSFLSPEPIPRSIFTGVRNVPVSVELENILGDPIELARAVREITRFSLAKIDFQRDTLQLHRLVQLVLRDKLTPDEQEQTKHTAHLLLANVDPRTPDAVGSWSRYAELLPHIRVVDAKNCSDRWVRRMAINAVNYLYAFGDPSGALELARDFAVYWSEKLGDEHLDTLVVSRWWGRMLRAIGRFEEGRMVTERTLELMRQTLTDKHEETLLTMHTVASDLRAKGDFEAAREMNKDAYESAVVRFGEDDPDTLAAANNYALSLRLVGAFFAARDLDEKTVERKKLVLGEDHRHTLLTLDNLSVDLRETGDYLGARRVQEDTVHRMRKELGNRHPMTLAAIKNLAIAYRKAGRHQKEEALRLAREATQGLVTKYGESHPDAMSATMDLSIEYRHEGDLVEARRLGTEVKNLYEQSWGEKHPFTLAGATNLAVTLRLQGSVEQARELNERAFADMREVLGADHPFTLVCATNYASDMAASGGYEAAYGLDQDTLARSVRTLGENHPSSLALLVNQALDLRGLGRQTEADAMQETAVHKLQDVLGPEHPATNGARLNHRANCDIDPMQI
jgi:Tetratricopeptide repeat/NB-ARC domain